MGHSLQKKLTLFVVVLILAMAALLSTVSYLQLRGQLLDSVRSESQAAAEGNTHFIEEWVVSKRSVINSLVPVALTQEAIPYFKRAVEAGNFDLVYAGYADKHISFSSPQNMPPGYDPTVRPWYRQAADSGLAILTPPYLDAASG